MLTKDRNKKMAKNELWRKTGHDPMLDQLRRRE